MPLSAYKLVALRLAAASGAVAHQPFFPSFCRKKSAPCIPKERLPNIHEDVTQRCQRCQRWAEEDTVKMPHIFPTRGFCPNCWEHCQQSAPALCGESPSQGHMPSQAACTP